MNTYRKLWLSIYVGAFLSFGPFAPALTAQCAPNTTPKPENPAPSNEGWHVDVIPYLWFSGGHGTSGVLGHEASIHADAADVLSNFNIGFMGVVEPRYNRILFSRRF